MIEGVKLRTLEMHRDDRGHLTELFRRDWSAELDAFTPQQWHILTSRAGSLRGMHAHARHDDFKIVIHGEVTLGLKDLRSGSATEDEADVLELSGQTCVGVLIPAGVAHGILSLSDSITMVGVTMPYDPGDDFECDWADPELGIEWPGVPTLLSERDRHAGTMAELRSRLRHARALPALS
jgi:dTDP-4-dehydrorhamnose 3,5-epimerase